MHAGDRVEVFSAFNRRWVSGFEIAEVLGNGYRVRRSSDGMLLPNATSADDLREAVASRHPSFQP